MRTWTIFCALSILLFARFQFILFFFSFIFALFCFVLFFFFASFLAFFVCEINLLMHEGSHHQRMHGTVHTLYKAYAHLLNGRYILAYAHVNSLSVCVCVADLSYRCTIFTIFVVAVVVVVLTKYHC